MKALNFGKVRENGKTSHAHVYSTNDIVKMTILLKAIHRIHLIPIQISFCFFTETQEKNPKIHMEPHNTIESQNILEQKEKCQK